MTVANAHDVPEAAADMVALLAEEGVSHFFINPGTDSAPLQEALAAARAAGTPTPKAVLCVHESVALAPAIGHHMISGRPQAVMVHVDAGTLNLGCQIHNAQRNRTPVVVFAGRALLGVQVAGDRSYPDGASVQANDFPQTQLTPDSDYVALAMACGGTGQTVHTPQDIGDAVRWALSEADQGHCAVLDVRLPQP